MGIWESEYYINSNPGPVSSIWYCRPRYPTNHSPWPLWNPGHITQLVQSYLHPRFFRVAVDGKYTSLRELRYGVPEGSCSGANLFTCYCSLIKDQIDNSMTLTAFANDHSIHNNFRAGNKVQERKIKTDLEDAFTQQKHWMDTLHPKLDPDKAEYILFISWQQLKKTSPEPLNAPSDHTIVSNEVRYLAGFLDQHLNFKKHIKEKAKKAMANII